MKLILGIRAQLVAGIVLLTTAGIGLIGFLSVNIVETRSVYWKIIEAGHTVRLVRFMTSGMKEQSLAGVADNLKPLSLAAAALREVGIDTFEFIDAGGAVILRQGKLSREVGKVIYDSGALKVISVGSGWLAGPGEYLYVIAAMRGEGVKSGKLEFIVPLTDINNDMSVVRQFIFFYALLDSFIIIAFGIYFLSRLVINPVRALEAAAKRISGGALGERADVPAENELGALAASFNVMAGRVEEEIKTLERMNLELVSKEDELLRSKTLAAVGGLAAGIAHEIGNPLGAVHGYIDILSKGAGGKAEEKDLLERLAKEVGRIDVIVREFLDVARPSSRPPHPVDVSSVVKEAVSAVAVHKDFKGISVTVKGATQTPLVAIDEGKLRQVVINLLLNAAHAVKDARKDVSAVMVETGVRKRPVTRALMPHRRRDDQPATAAEVSAPEKDYVFVSVADAGSGMTEQESRKIFEPFFTTKEVGSGTGLGLFISQSIIKAYGGVIEFATKQGEGSVFIVFLPVGQWQEPERAENAVGE